MKGWLLALMIWSAAPLWADESSAVRRAFDAYTVAMIRRDGKAVAGLVDQASLVYFESLRKRALLLNRPELERQRLMDKLMILTLRHTFSRSKLEAMNGSQTLAKVVHEGGVSSSLQNLPAGPVRFPRPGYAQLSLQGEPVRYDFALHKEHGVWKFAMAELCQQQNARLEREWEGSQDAKDLLELVNTNGHKPDPQILDGPLNH